MLDDNNTTNTNTDDEDFEETETDPGSSDGDTEEETDDELSEEEPTHDGEDEQPETNVEEMEVRPSSFFDDIDEDERQLIRDAAADLLSACACEAAGSVYTMIANVHVAGPTAKRTKKDIDAFIDDTARALAGAAYTFVSSPSYDDLTSAEIYAEAEALVREGWSPPNPIED